MAQPQGREQFVGVASGDSPMSQSMAIAGDLELSRFVEIMRTTVGASIEYQPAELSKRVTLRLREAMTPTELWDAMAATLEANGVAIIDTGKPGLFKALPIVQAPQAARVLLPHEAEVELFGERAASGGRGGSRIAA